MASAATAASAALAASAATAQAANPLSTLAETLLAKMQAEMQLRPDQQDSLRLQQEALRYTEYIMNYKCLSQGCISNRLALIRLVGFVNFLRFCC